MRERAASDAPDQLGGRVALAVAVDVFAEPLAERLEFTAGEHRVEIAQVFSRLLEILRSVEISERVGGEIADQARAPVDVLQNAVGIGRQTDTEILVILVAPRRRLVTPFSVMLFHPMKWQSEENVVIGEAAEWARHFTQLEKDMDRLLAELFGYPNEKIQEWIRACRYVTGPELAEAGLAELTELKPLEALQKYIAAEARKRPKR